VKYAAGRRDAKKRKEPDVLSFTANMVNYVWEKTKFPVSYGEIGSIRQGMDQNYSQLPKICLISL
jgi:hypothetical protein